jgi:hypothetical protein
MGREYSTHEEEEEEEEVFVGKPEGRRTVGMSRHRLENNIKIGLRERGCGDMHWINLAQDWDQWRLLVNTVMNRWVP